MKSVRKEGENAVNEGEVGTFGGLAPRSIKDGMTPDHVPSYASVRKALDDADIEISDEQMKALRNNTICVVVKTCDHQSFSRTFGGRNSKSKIESDAKDLYEAAEADLQTWEPVWESNGWTRDQIKSAREQVHKANKNLFKDLGIKYGD
ncbi:hypothetical protein IT774_10240 [Salinimonas marina]|uniref:Uncharacterized protein n=1 Tax=Salinimonas marina TaxID=2785918 RepID=A0A7S9DVD5_9ALTE|nr:hypothetical protein [Salinimonas marina]QPG04613.1 hypothetical protein IT774_10240 [Salinimonas marina]